MLSNEWYVKKRDEMYRAYKAALEMEELHEAERLFKEYETYAKLCVPAPPKAPVAPQNVTIKENGKLPKLCGNGAQ